MTPDTTAQLLAGSELLMGAHEALSGDTQTLASAQIREISIITVNVTTSVPTGW